MKETAGLEFKFGIKYKDEKQQKLSIYELGTFCFSYFNRRRKNNLPYVKSSFVVPQLASLHLCDSTWPFSARKCVRIIVVLALNTIKHNFQGDGRIEIGRWKRFLTGKLAACWKMGEKWRQGKSETAVCSLYDRLCKIRGVCQPVRPHEEETTLLGPSILCAFVWLWSCFRECKGTASLQPIQVYVTTPRFWPFGKS